MNVIIPDDLAELPRWGVWRMETGAKVPYRAAGGGASSTNPLHWGELDSARAALASGSFSGLAFAFFKEDGIVGIDLDDSLYSDGGRKRSSAACWSASLTPTSRCLPPDKA